MIRAKIKIIWIFFIASALSTFTACEHGTRVINWDEAGPCDILFVRTSFASADTSTTMGITWHTKENCKSVVAYHSAQEAEKLTEGTEFFVSDNLKYEHNVLLENLKPRTKYYYKVGENPQSTELSFTTAPSQNECAAVRFVVASDSRSDAAGKGSADAWDDIVEEIYSNTQFDFLVNSGDMVYKGSSDTDWLAFLSGAPSIFAFKPLMISIGNHDIGPDNEDKSYFNKIFFYPKNSLTASRDFYYFKYGNSLFVILSTSTFTDIFPQVALWLDDILTQNKDSLWKFVIYHHPSYSSLGTGINKVAGHAPNELDQNKYFIPIFDKHHVDIVLSAHNHYYERFAPSRGGIEDRPNPVNNFAGGTVYVVSGGGGAPNYQKVLVDQVCKNSRIEGSEACYCGFHYLYFEIKNNVLNFESRATAVQPYENSLQNRKLLDAFSIIKPPPPLNPCASRL